MISGTPAEADPAQTDKRFEFGANWRRFLEVLDERRIEESKLALAEMLGVDTLAGKTFLDIGSGSGLSSLAAMRLGAARVYSFDYDEDSVACTAELRRRYYPDSENWTVERGDATDRDYITGLGEFDIVYSWGVLHHTGAMWHAMENAAVATAPGGRLFVALYNDQGRQTRRWSRIKRLYVRLPDPAKRMLVLAVVIPIELRALVGAIVRGRLVGYIRSWSDTRGRGMSKWHDHVDWVGGWPFEVATPDEVFRFYRDRGYSLLNMRTVGGNHGCNEWVFARGSS
jgi:2-polyprenyl-6-hydroxyphenyl methylase/3-demethylubiquinone-9 3-methyltransferase